MKTLVLIVLILAGAYYYLSQQKPGVGPKAEAGFRTSELCFVTSAGLLKSPETVVRDISWAWPVALVV